MVFCFCVVLYVALCGLQACTMTLYLCVVKWLVLYWEHEEGAILSVTKVYSCLYPNY